MVTLNFTMHREIAQMLEEAAYQQLKLLEKKQIGTVAYINTHIDLFFFLILLKIIKIQQQLLRKYSRNSHGFAKYFAVFQ